MNIRAAVTQCKGAPFEIRDVEFEQPRSVRSEGRSRFGCSNTNGMPSKPSQKSIDV